jgi:phosphoglycolate phosphatase
MIFSYLCSAKVTKMKYKAIIFDLDGTLTDTLEDLFLSVNHALRSCSLPERSLDEVRKFVGNGVRKLIERSVPEGTQSTVLEKCFEAFRAHYIIHCQDHTCLYPGIATLLMTLHARGYRMAVVSNKLQTGVDELARTFFKGIIDVAIGEQQGIPRKPEPDMVEAALSQLGVSKEEVIYVGDSDVDLQTASNAGLPCISVLWGFRSRDFLVAHGATILAEKPQDVLSLV